MSNLKHSEHRWAIVVKWRSNDESFASKFFWPGVSSHTLIRTFQTRKLAREAKKQMDHCQNRTRIVKVIVTIDVE